MTQRGHGIIVLLLFGLISISITSLLVKDRVREADHYLETQENIEILLHSKNEMTIRRILGKPEPIEVRIVK